MAKLSEETLEQGRSLVRAKDLDGLCAWVKQHLPARDVEDVRKAFELPFSTDNTAMAMKLFDRVFPEADPTVEAAALFIRTGCALFFFLGILGGVIYLFRLILGY